MYDTPGTDSTKDAMLHAVTLRASLTSLPINLIMVEASVDKPYVTILKEIEKLLAITDNGRKLAVCLLSRLDLLFEKEAN
jgi:hypothetical protein